VGLSHHAAHGAHEQHIGGRSGAVGGTIEGLAIDADRKAAQDYRGAIDAIVHTDQPDVVFVQSESVFFPKDEGRRRGGRSGAQQHLEAYTRDGTCRFTHLARLEAAASPVIALAAFVVLPAASGIHVVQNLLAHVHLAAQAAEHRSAPAGRFAARGFAQGDLELFRFVGKGPVGFPVLALGEFLAGEGFFGETTDAHDGCVGLCCVVADMRWLMGDEE
jgi:hypothetical protein